MICPNCKTENELSWKRYASAPFSRFTCIECTTRFKLKRPFYYWLLPLALTAGILVGGVAIIYYMVGTCDYGAYAKPAVIALTVSLTLLFIVIDKRWEKSFETIATKII